MKKFIKTFCISIIGISIAASLVNYVETGSFSVISKDNLVLVLVILVVVSVISAFATLSDDK